MKDTKLGQWAEPKAEEETKSNKSKRGVANYENFGTRVQSQDPRSTEN